MPRSASDKGLKISDLSRVTGVPVSTLRIWGDQGLLHPKVTPAGYRIYNEGHVRQVADIKRLRTLQGLSIAAIKASLPDAPAGDEADTGSDAATAPAGPIEAGNNAIGARLRALRRARNFTIKEAAKAAGVDASVLASIERTSLGVQIPEAKALASFYGVTLTSLMASPLSDANKEIATLAEGGQILPTLGRGLRIEQLATGRDMMDCQRWFLDPGVNSHGSYSHDGEEFVYVLLGEFRLVIEDTRIHHLHQGESIYFKSNWKHAWSNPGKTTAVLLWVNTPPSF